MGYTNEKNILILIALLKERGIRKVIASPGTTNVTLIASMQQDPFFEIYSSVDERSAAYIACGLAVESGEPVVISCTGATASRNYFSGLTEAYYRKIPVIAVTSSRFYGYIGHNMDQVIDRSTISNDISVCSVNVPVPHNVEEIWNCEIKINKAFNELVHNGGGPVHINLETEYSTDFSVKSLPCVRNIKKYLHFDKFPSIEKEKVAVFVGSHSVFSDELTREIDFFCEKYNAVVLCDSTSNYFGKYKVYFNIILQQEGYLAPCRSIDLMIHIGNTSSSGVYTAKEVWRVNPDGQIRDTFHKCNVVFDMEEIEFFQKANIVKKNKNISFYEEWKKEYDDLISKICDKEDFLPLSNLWIGMSSYKYIPNSGVIHLGILNSLRSWNYFDDGRKYYRYANTGGYGIDGGISSLIGASLANKDKIFWGIYGDLAFFYDMNVLGNRAISNNIRIIIINNGIGSEFKNHLNLAQRAGFGDEADDYIAAKGHFGNKSKELIKHYANDLGYEYISINDKKSFLEKRDYFFSDKMHNKPIIMEIFTECENDTKVMKIIRNIKFSSDGILKKAVKKIQNTKQLIDNK